MLEITDVEKYRIDNNLSKADLARYFGVLPQNYNNWVYRKSLPKEFIGAAFSLVGFPEGNYPAHFHLSTYIAREFANGNLNDKDVEVIEAFVKGRLSVKEVASPGQSPITAAPQALTP